MGDYITIHARDKKHTLHYTMNGIEKELPSEKFLRIHRSYIVALDEIESLDGNEIFLKTMSRIPAGGVYKSELLEKFKDSFIIGNQKKGGL